jgi:hypothetical protein
MNKKTFQSIFIFLLFLTVLISFYIFVSIIVLKDNTYKNIFSTWQFPMLLAIFLETWLGISG